ncbi:hypothetical protein [Streptomyces griseorubiginosus]|uniref:hypothetical protein n=1 Tax=Streptomyces griseorubiginosus TaxID=67304 RepID=UPI0033F2176F
MPSGCRRISTISTTTPAAVPAPTAGPAYDRGAVSSVTKSKTGRPAAVSSAGTSATTPSTGNGRCRTGRGASRLRRRKWPAQATFTTMQTPIPSVTITVAGDSGR